jgi:hypothetical protein
VPLTAIVVHVTRPGRRADELLVAVAKHLGRGTQIPDERGHVRILLEESEGAAWQPSTMRLTPPAMTGTSIYT